MIDTKLLRQKILDLAIRGKLVPQDPADEPASELLKKIKAEKDALVKAGKIKKDKHESFIFKGDDNRYYETIDGKTADITDEIPFDLPESWVWCRLRSLGQIVGGGTPSTTNQSFWNGSIPWLSPADLTGYTKMYISHGKKNITDEGLEKSSATLMPAGSILYSSRAPIGYVVISKNSISTNQGFKSLVPTIAGMSEFYYYALKARTSDIKQRATGTTFKEISGKDFGDTLVPLPPYNEQKRIVSQIETLLGYVDIIDTDAETLDKTLTLAKQKILDLAIRGKLVPQDSADEPASELLKKIKAEKEALVKAGKIKKDKHESYIFKGDDNCYHENIDGKVTDITEEIPFDLPESWVWCRLHDIAFFQNGYAFKSSEIKPTGDVPVIRISNLDGSVVSLKQCLFAEQSSTLSDFLIKKGDLLIAMSGATTGKLGIYNNVQEAYLNQRVGNIKLYCRDERMLMYRNLIIASQQKNILEMAYGGAQPNISGEKICNLPIPLPPLAEQKRIVSQVEKFFSVLETMRG